MLRALLLILLLVVPIHAEAIVVTCGAGFPCNPATGGCFTSWEACHFDGGVPPCIPHGECSGDPSSCFEAAIKEEATNGGLPSNWGIAPGPGSVACEMPGTLPIILALKSDFEWIGLRNYINRIDGRITRLSRAISRNNEYGNPLSARAAAAGRRLSWLYTISSLLWDLVTDPPNPNYQSFPGPSTAYPPITLPPPDATMTQTQLNEHAVWLNAMRDTAIVGRQLTEVMNNLAGALAAAEAGTPGAATWVQDLAAYWDTVAATLAQQGAAEIAARAGLSGPVVLESAGCGDAIDAATGLGVIITAGNTSYQGFLGSSAIEGTCPLAATFPASMTDDGGADAVAYAGLTTIGMAASLCAANAAYCAPSIHVTAPNGGEVLALGVPTTITWTTANQPGDVFIKVSVDTGVTWTTVATVPNSGSYVWTPSATSATALVKVKSVGAATVDQSDATFFVGSLTVTKPEGHVWDIGSAHKILWTATGFPGNVKISASWDGGTTYLNINANAPNTGTYTWTVIGPATSQFLVKIKSVVNQDIKDTSNLPSVLQ